MVKRSKTLVPVKVEYDTLLSRVSELLEAARQASARSVNTIITLTYWNIGWQIVEHEQSGDQRATYGKTLLAQLSTDLTAKYGRGFSRANLEYMRRFYRLWSIPQTLSGESKAHSKQIKPHKNQTMQPASFPLPWSHYVRPYVAHWTHNDENPPVGLILCASKGETLVKYALDGLPNKVLAAEYKMALPNEKILVEELNKCRRRFENDKGRKSQK